MGSATRSDKKLRSKKGGTTSNSSLYEERVFLWESCLRHPEFISGSFLIKIPKQVRNDKMKIVLDKLEQECFVILSGFDKLTINSTKNIAF